MAHKPSDRPGFSGKPWPQYQSEIDGFIKLLVEENCRSYLEIGCRYGDTYHAVGCALPTGSKLVALDLPGAKSGFRNKGGHQNSGDYLIRAAEDLSKRGQTTEVILGDSHSRDIVKLVSYLAPFDAILIDGDHTAEGVQADLTFYGPMSSKLIAFHDICGKGKWSRQIRPIYHKARLGRRYQEFVHDNARRGIGVIWN